MEVTRNCAVIAYGEYGRDDASHDAKIVLAGIRVKWIIEALA